jgi:hypothetical protein
VNLRVRSDLMALVDSALNRGSMIVDVIVVLTIDEECGLHSVGSKDVQ